MNAGRTTICPKCRESVTPEEFAKSPNLRESATVLFMPITTTVVNKLDRRHLRCPECSHEWRPRLQERHIVVQLIVWPILIAGCLMGIAVIVLAITGHIP